MACLPVRRPLVRNLWIICFAQKCRPRRRCRSLLLPCRTGAAPLLLPWQTFVDLSRLSLLPSMVSPMRCTPRQLLRRPAWRLMQRQCLSLPSPVTLSQAPFVQRRVPPWRRALRIFSPRWTHFKTFLLKTPKALLKLCKDRSHLCLLGPKPLKLEQMRTAKRSRTTLVILVLVLRRFPRVATVTSTRSLCVIKTMAQPPLKNRTPTLRTSRAPRPTMLSWKLTAPAKFRTLQTLRQTPS
mmetsp:Transcript_21446/g.42098  ORF Transcript_21446/g.42098 Transcript_21446/m.42098 type:complete len:239 (-) Transcript_21446:740-1456(-)